MDNPTYDEGIRVNHHSAERHFRNPVYSDISHGSPNTTNSQTRNMYKGVYKSGSAMVSEALYENTHNSAPGALTDGEEQANGGQGMTRETTSSEAIYDMPSALDNVDDDNCYSALGPVDYFTLQPHTTKATQQQLPPNDDEYSYLQHK